MRTGIESLGKLYWYDHTDKPRVVAPVEHTRARTIWLHNSFEMRLNSRSRCFRQFDCTTSPTNLSLTVTWHSNPVCVYSCMYACEEHKAIESSQLSIDHWADVILRPVHTAHETNEQLTWEWKAIKSRIFSAPFLPRPNACVLPGWMPGLFNVEWSSTSLFACVQCAHKQKEGVDEEDTIQSKLDKIVFKLKIECERTVLIVSLSLSI